MTCQSGGVSEDDAGVPLTRVFGERMLHDNLWVRLGQVEIAPPDGRRFWHDVVRLRSLTNSSPYLSEPTSLRDAEAKRAWNSASR
jgi:hypothetical protein